jgi:glyoxylase I family protein
MDARHDLVSHLRRLEEDLMRPAIRSSRAELEARLTPDFVEIGRSGRAYDRASIIVALAAEGDDPAMTHVEDFVVRRLAPGVALATYRSVREGAAGSPPSVARRTSIWCLDADGSWRMTFHQGTPSG